MAGDPYWNNVVLAMHMDGANASTVFTDSKGHTLTAVGNAQISTAQSKFGGASALFDGTGDFISTPYSTDWNFGDGDFTIEMFVRPTSLAANMELISQRNSAVVSDFWLFRLMTSGVLYFGAKANSFDFIAATSTGVLTAGTWHHVAVVRKDRWVMFFIGGVLSGKTGADAPNPLFTSVHPLYIGASHELGNTPYNGYIDDLRITKGVARYTANFTPPTLAFPDAPAMISGTVKDSTGTLGPRAVRVHRKSDGALSGATTSHSTTGVFSVPALDASNHYAVVHDSDADPYWPNVVLATHFDTDSVIDPYMSSVVLGLHMEGANASAVFQDVTGKAVTANGNVALSTDTARFGNTSAKFDGTTDWLSTPDAADLRMGAAQFTIEGWVYFTSLPAVSGTSSLIVKGATGVSNFEFTVVMYNNAGTYQLVYQNSSTGTTVAINYSQNITLASGVWRHFAVTRNTTTTYLFLDGTLLGSVADTTAIFGGTSTLSLGANYAGAGCLTGYLDDVRITKGICRYTSTFTPSAVPFSSFKDLTGNDLMVNGVPSISTATKQYGDGALYFDGAGDCVEVAPAASWKFLHDGTVSFTLEAWVYWQGGSLGLTILSTAASSSDTGLLLSFIAASGRVPTVQRFLGVPGASQRWTASQGIADSAWTHLAFVFDNATGYGHFYINGIQSGQGAPTITGAASSASSAAPSYPLAVGRYQYITPAGYFNGYIDDLRVTNGVARYQSAFTPPERAFPGAMSAGTANALIYDNLTPV